MSKKKKTETLPASLPEKNDFVENKDAIAFNSNLKQEGFGNKDFFENSHKKSGLEQSILSAMQHASIKTDQVSYVPSLQKRKKLDQKGQGPNKKFALQDKFKVV